MLRRFNSAYYSYSVAVASSSTASAFLALIALPLSASCERRNAAIKSFARQPIVFPDEQIEEQKAHKNSVSTRAYYFDRASRDRMNKRPLPTDERSEATDSTFVEARLSREESVKRRQAQRVPLETPTTTSSSSNNDNNNNRSSSSNSSRSRSSRRIGEEVISQLARRNNVTETRFIERRQREADLLEKMSTNVDQMWYNSKQHLRDQDKLIENIGSVEGAVRETLQPTSISFREELRRRPLDHKILEEIHREQHGLRVERHLRKGILHEHWVAQSANNFPVMDASKRARSLLGFGGQIEEVVRAKSATQFPVSSAPEVAFVGRTNCGRSSLINALLNTFVCQHGALPGTTCTANFYSVANSRLMLVDLPGYGFYHPSQTTVADAENATRLLKQYLTNGAGRNIKRVFLCSSSTGLSSADIAYVELLEKHRVPFSVICTKTDLVAVKMLAKTVDYTRAQLSQFRCCHELMMVSSLRLAGVNKIQNVLADMARREHRSLADAAGVASMAGGDDDYAADDVGNLGDIV